MKVTNVKLLKLLGLENAGRCAGCKMVLLKTAPSTVTRAGDMFCSDECADRWQMRRRERRVA